MNCIEFRRVKLSAPRSLDPRAMLHQKHCPRCHAFAQEIDETEQQLERFAAQSVPSGLEERILLYQAKRSFRRVRHIALAATAVLVSGVGFFGWDHVLHQDAARLAIEHVASEPYALTTVRNNDMVFFEKALADFGGQLRAPLGKIRYMTLCSEAEENGWHVVLETEQGLATLMLIPGSRVNAQTVASSQGWHALAEPAGRGHYAIITRTQEQTEAVKQLIRERVSWS